jgi:hypothetical protein
VLVGVRPIGLATSIHVWPLAGWVGVLGRNIQPALAQPHAFAELGTHALMLRLEVTAPSLRADPMFHSGMQSDLSEGQGPRIVFPLPRTVEVPPFVPSASGAITPLPTSPYSSTRLPSNKTLPPLAMELVPKLPLLELITVADDNVLDRGDDESAVPLDVFGLLGLVLESEQPIKKAQPIAMA